MRGFVTVFITVLATAGMIMSADVRGVVLDENRNPIAGATVITISDTDSAFIDGVITNPDGRFDIKSDSRGMVLKVSFLGYHTHIGTPAHDSENIVQLKPDSKTLEEVTIVADHIKYKAGGYSARLDGSRLTEGKETPQMLAYLPGISETNGEISVLSRSPAAIYVDGIKIASQDELKSIPASMIRSVDVSFIAGAGELTSSGGAVLKIRLNKDENMGYSGYIKGETEVMPDYGYRGEGATGYISGRYNKLSVSNHLYYKRVKLIGDNATDYEFSNGEQKAEDVKYRGWAPYIYDRLNMTYEFNNRHSLSLSGMLSHNGSNTTSTGEEKHTQLTTFSQHNGNSTNTIQTVANYTWQWDNNASGLYVTGDYMRVESKDSLDIDNHGLSNERSNNNLYSAKVETKFHPWGGSMSAGAGYKGSASEVDVSDNGKTHTDMRVHRPYLFAGYQGEAGMFNYEIGLRYQWNRMTVDVVDNRDRNRFNGLCPSLSMVYIINPIKGHIVMVNYERALDEIPYSAISSYRHYTTPYWYETGNPSITTPINDNIMAMLSLFSRFTLTAGAYLSKDQIYYATEEKEMNGNSMIVTTAKNGNHQTMVFGQMEYKLTAGEWWDAKPYVTLSSIWASTPDYHVSNQSRWKIGLSNTLTFSKTSGATLDGYWESNHDFFNMRMKSVGGINGSLYKNLVKNKLQLKLDFTIWRKGRTVITNGSGVTTIDRNYTRTPHLILSARWNFKGGKKVEVKNNITESQQYYQYSNPGINK